MAKIINGERIGERGKLMVGSSAVIFDSSRQKILLTRRTDNDQWCLPGGRMEPGENISEACIREVREETGLRVRVSHLIGVYTSPHRIIEYADGNRFQMVSFNFEVEVIDGTLGLSDETTDYGYFSPDEIENLELMEHHQERIEDALAAQNTTIIR